jgi:hypothetical protein
VAAKNKAGSGKVAVLDASAKTGVAKVAEQRKKLKLAGKVGKARGKPVQKPKLAEESTASPASLVDSESALAAPTASPAKAARKKSK